MPKYEFTAPEPIRVEQAAEERIARRPKVTEEVTGPAALAFFMLLVAGVGFQFGAVALIVAGLGSLAFMSALLLAYWHNANVRIAKRWEKREEPQGATVAPESPAMPVNKRGQLVMKVKRRVPITVIDGDFQWEFTLEDIAKLERWLADSNAIRRDANGDDPGMTALDGVTTNNYKRLMLALKRAKVATGPDNASLWTELGEAWIKGETGPVVYAEE